MTLEWGEDWSKIHRKINFRVLRSTEKTKARDIRKTIHKLKWIGIGPVMWLEEQTTVAQLAYYVLDATGKYKEPRKTKDKMEHGGTTWIVL